MCEDQMFWREVANVTDFIATQATQVANAKNVQKETCESGQKVSCENVQKEACASHSRPKKLAVKRNKTLGVRKSGKLMNVCRDLVHIDLVDDNEGEGHAFHGRVFNQTSSNVVDPSKHDIHGGRLHAGIMTPHVKAQPSGNIMRKGKVFLTIDAVRAEVAKEKIEEKMKKEK